MKNWQKAIAMSPFMLVGVLAKSSCSTSSGVEVIQVVEAVEVKCTSVKLKNNLGSAWLYRCDYDGTVCFVIVDGSGNAIDCLDTFISQDSLVSD